jgi:hypothetical protein
MISVGVNPPHTPVTAGSDGISAATTPNVCKMPGPPAPFVPTPLPNIGQSNDRPGDYTQTVKIEGKAIAIRGSYFMSKGDIASKGTGGGLISAATHGKTEFVAPGSMNVNAEGENIQYLGDMMTNNGASPSNGGTTLKELQAPNPDMDPVNYLTAVMCYCNTIKPSKKKKENCRKLGRRKHACCDRILKRHQKSGNPPHVGGEQGYRLGNDMASQALNMSRGQARAAGVLSASCWPDACFTGPDGNVRGFADFKFRCPDELRKDKSAGHPGWTRYPGGFDQRMKYMMIGMGLDPPATMEPLLINTSACK